MTDQESYQNGRYVVVRELGRGGTGVVLLAYDTGIQRHVALKVLPPADDTHAARLKREATVMGALNHQNIATIFDLFIEDGRPCLVLEYIPGWDFEKFMQTQPLDEGFCIHLLHEVGKALVFLHRTAARHADITPRNILIRDDYTVKLIDFGLAKRPTDPRLTKTGYFGGTRGYVAPEVWRTGNVSEPSDIWSLGTVMQQAIDSLPVLPHRNCPLMSVINLMLQEQPERRPAADEVVAMISPWVTPVVPAQAQEKTSPEEERGTVEFISDDTERLTEPFIPTGTVPAPQSGTPHKLLHDVDPTLGTSPSDNDAQVNEPAASASEEPLIGVILTEDGPADDYPKSASPEDSFEPLVGVVLTSDEALTSQEPQAFTGTTIRDEEPANTESQRFEYSDPARVNTPPDDARDDAPEPSRSLGPDPDASLQEVPQNDSAEPEIRTSSRPAWAVALAALVLIPLSLSLILGRPFWEFSQPGNSGSVSEAVHETASAIPTSPAVETQSPAEADLNQALAGPWTAQELAELLQEPSFKYRLAAAFTPSKVGVELSAVSYQKISLEGPDLDFLNGFVDRTTGTGPYHHALGLRLTGNKGKVDLTPHVTGCPELASDSAPEDPTLLPGFYMIVSLTDSSSEFAGKWVSRATEPLTYYGLVRSKCLAVGEDHETIPARSKLAWSRELGLVFDLPKRPDGSRDEASATPLGFLLVSKEGHVAMLEEE